MVDDAEALRSLHHVLEVDVMIMALALALGQRLVLRVLDAGHQRGALYGVLALGNGQQVSLVKPLEKGLPLLRVPLVLGIEVSRIDRRMRVCLAKTLPPRTCRKPLGGLLTELLVGEVLGVIAFHVAGNAESLCTGRKCQTEE